MVSRSKYDLFDRLKIHLSSTFTIVHFSFCGIIHSNEYMDICANTQKHIHSITINTKLQSNSSTTVLATAKDVVNILLELPNSCP